VVGGLPPPFQKPIHAGEKAFERINRIDLILKRSDYKIQLIKKIITT